MSIKNSNSIAVYNYNNFNVTMPTNIAEYFFEPCTNGVPSIQYMSLSEIMYVNSRSNCFRTGLLTFADEDKEEIFSELKYDGWRDNLTNSEIEDIILNPTKDGLEKLINVKDDLTFERIRGILTALQNSNANDISTRVVRAVEHRYTELRRGILKTQIKISAAADKAENKELASVKEKNKELLAKLEEMQKKLDNLSKPTRSKTSKG